MLGKGPLPGGNVPGVEDGTVLRCAAVPWVLAASTHSTISFLGGNQKQNNQNNLAADPQVSSQEQEKAAWLALQTVSLARFEELCTNSPVTASKDQPSL